MTIAARPLVSVVIPCHNQGEFVAEAVSSALAQREVSVEVIVVDDGSTDDTREVLARFGDAIRVIRNPVATERGAARNRGATAASGEHIAFLDADDWWLRGKLTAQLRLAGSRQASLTDWESVDAAGRILGRFSPPSTATLADVVSGCGAFNASSLVVTREMFHESGGYPEDLAVQGSEDWLFVAKLVAAGVRIAAVPEPLVRYRVHGGQWTSAASRRAASMWAATAWLERHGHVHGKGARRLRASTAGVIAAGFAFEGKPAPATRWLAQAGRQGLARELARATGRVAISSVTGALRRHGFGAFVEFARLARSGLRVWPVRRIVFFTPGYHERGGAAARSRIIACELAARGYSVRVIARAGSLRRPRITRAPGLVVLELPGCDSRRLGGLLYLACAIPLGVLWGRGSCRYLALQLVSPSMAAAICAAVRRRPFFALSSTSGTLTELDDITGSRLAWLRARLLRRAELLIAQTAEGAEELERLAAPGCVSTLSNPVRSADFTALDGRPRGLYCGRFSEEKDLPRLLDAWRVIAAERPEARLRLVGGGGLYRSVESELRARVASDVILRDAVCFGGWVEDVAGELARADLFVFPSCSEGMSNALLEACACRRIVVASDIAPNRAVLGDDYPLLFAAGDTHALIQQLRTALDDGAIRARALAQIERRLPEFSVNRVIDRLEALLDAADRPRHL